MAIEFKKNMGAQFEAMHFVAAATAGNTLVPQYARCVRVEHRGEATIFVATDSHRLHFARLEHVATRLIIPAGNYEVTKWTKTIIHLVEVPDVDYPAVADLLATVREHLDADRKTACEQIFLGDNSSEHIWMAQIIRAMRDGAVNSDFLKPLIDRSWDAWLPPSGKNFMHFKHANKDESLVLEAIIMPVRIPKN